MKNTSRSPLLVAAAFAHAGNGHVGIGTSTPGSRLSVAINRIVPA